MKTQKIRLTASVLLSIKEVNEALEKELKTNSITWLYMNIRPGQISSTIYRYIKIDGRIIDESNKLEYAINYTVGIQKNKDKTCECELLYKNELELKTK